jgi:phosphoribosylaminoimidazolecarboxamide formyltransferase/IMP cyclohydrolase
MSKDGFSKGSLDGGSTGDLVRFSLALVSCSEKAGLVEFLRPLVERGLRIVSTGGTASHLRSHGFEVLDVSSLTGFPEVMDGRVKTLHPHVHMALLARQTEPGDLELLKQRGLSAFDLVVVNLYPFEAAQAAGKTGDALIEMIDVGGPSMLRAAAKNFQSVTVVSDPQDYPHILEGRYSGVEGRRALAGKVFEHTASYDALIARSFNDGAPEFYCGSKVQDLRYGENPHQKAIWLRQRGGSQGLHRAEILQGKELSYNNILDLDAASRALRDLAQPECAVAVKHNSPCGAARGENLLEACRRTLAADPVSVFGGILALSSKVNAATATELCKVFLECVIAPAYEPEALAIFAKKKNLRILQWPEILKAQPEWRWRSVTGGMLVQESDQVLKAQSEYVYWGYRPNAKIESDLMFAWRICAHLKSNAIAIVGEGQTLGLGMGQVNRVDAVDQAIQRFQQFHPKAKTPVLASDAFFPFPDSIEIAAKAGIQWIIQPGGSVRDAEVRATAEKLKVNILLTNQRHFLH